MKLRLSYASTHRLLESPAVTLLRSEGPEVSYSHFSSLLLALARCKGQTRLTRQPPSLSQIDRQEALIKAENRRIQIERANKMLYDETDRVKSFHCKLLLSDVIQVQELTQGHNDCCTRDPIQN